MERQVRMITDSGRIIKEIGFFYKRTLRIMINIPAHPMSHIIALQDRTPLLSHPASSVCSHSLQASIISQRKSQPQHREKAGSLSTYFATVKTQIINKELKNDSQTVKEIIAIFLAETSKENAALKVVIACLNILCLILHGKGGADKTVIKEVKSLKFIGCLLRLNVEEILKANPNLESSLCYLLLLCGDARLLSDKRFIGLMPLYKRFSLDLFGLVSNNAKVVFNTLRIISLLQEGDQIGKEEYLRYSLMENVSHKLIAVESENVLLYELATRIIMKAEGEEGVVRLYDRINYHCKQRALEGLFRAVVGSKLLLGDNSFSKILELELSREIQPSFYKLICSQIRGMNTLRLVDLVQSPFLIMLAGKWVSAVFSNRMEDFVGVVASIQEKSKETTFHDAVLDKIATTMPFLPPGSLPQNQRW